MEVHLQKHLHYLQVRAMKLVSHCYLPREASANTHWPVIAIPILQRKALDFGLPSFPTSATRKAALHGRYYTCLSTTHNTHQLPVATCVSALPQQTPLYSAMPGAKPRATVAAQAEHDLGAPDTPTPESHLLAPHETVVMQTAWTNLENAVTRDAFTARILFDNRSQRSYITKAIANRLSLKYVGVNTLSITTFGATQPSPSQSPRVHVGLTQKDGRVLNITANVITVPVHCAVLSNLERGRQHLCLADNLPKQGEFTNIDL